MKTRITSIVSLGAILLVGSAAAIVNARVLTNNSAPRPTVVPVATSSIASPATTTSVAAFASTEPSLPASTVETETTLPAAPAPGTQTTYSIGEAATLIVDTAGGTLVIVAIAPHPGWSLVSAESDGPIKIEIQLASVSTFVEFRANLLFGVVGTSFEVTNIAQAPAVPLTSVQVAVATSKPPGGSSAASTLAPGKAPVPPLVPAKSATPSATQQITPPASQPVVQTVASTPTMSHAAPVVASTAPPTTVPERSNKGSASTTSTEKPETHGGDDKDDD